MKLKNKVKQKKLRQKMTKLKNRENEMDVERRNILIEKIRILVALDYDYNVIGRTLGIPRGAVAGYVTRHQLRESGENDED